MAAILVNCTCGKRMMVAEEKAGRYVLCPSCGKSVLTSVAGRTVALRDTSAPAKVSIAWGPIIKYGSILAVLGLFAALYFGPYKVQQQFDAMNPQIRGNITDVLTRGLEFATRSGMFEDPRALQHYTPTVHTDEIVIMRPLLVMSLPEEVEFFGTSSEGEYKGKYNTRTHTLTADAGVGAMTIPGVGAVSKSGATVKIAGLVNDHKPDVTVDGTQVPAKAPSRTK